MNSAEPVYYKPSGKCPPQSFLMAAIVIFLVAPVMGAIYGIAIYYCPLIYINFILTLVFGFFLGGFAGFLLRKGKMRNPKVSGFLTIVAAIVGLYVCWVVKLFFLFEFDLLVLLPNHIFGVLAELAEVGVWSIKGMTPKGFILVAVWVIEALVVLGTAFFMSAASLDHIFCEHCNRWVGEEEVEKRHLAMSESESEFETLFAEVQQGNVQLLNSLPPSPEGASSFIKMETSGCNTCKALNFLSLSTVVLSVDKQGETQAAEDELICRMFLKPSEFEALRVGKSESFG